MYSLFGKIHWGYQAPSLLIRLREAWETDLQLNTTFQSRTQLTVYFGQRLTPMLTDISAELLYIYIKMLLLFANN